MTWSSTLRLVLLLFTCTAALRSAKPQAQPASGAATAERPHTETAAQQRRLQAEAEHLVALAEALKKTLDHTRRDELSITVLREAEAVEQAARKLQQSAP